MIVSKSFKETITALILCIVSIILLLVSFLSDVSFGSDFVQDLMSIFVWFLVVCGAVIVSIILNIIALVLTISSFVRLNKFRKSGAVLDSRGKFVFVENIIFFSVELIGLFGILFSFLISVYFVK